MEQLIFLAIRKIRMPRYFAFGLGLSVVLFQAAVPAEYRRF